ncbi:VanZ family protein [Brevibacterium spongiae]|uniref:VanZ family protein n=1 Tax=Brevibacterium spongiae TaxID=2909672 RepID=A0ABY5SSL3_9MICO|nr:VanZ family protein [Brevibacterium spongiae]UVI36153.1 VanZ family protein [Brevibacterium spongiae]
MTDRDQRTVGAPLALLVLYTLFIAAITLTPQQMGTGPNTLIGHALDLFAAHRETAWLTYERVEKLGNVAMFIPFGFLAALHFGRRRWWLGFVVGASFSTAIEIFQGTVLTQTRFATLSDLVTNTIGAGIGALLGLCCMAVWPVRRTGSDSRREFATV